MMENSFISYHPFVNFFYFTVIITFSMYVTHPIFLLISFFSAIVYSTTLIGWRKSLKNNLFYTLPVMLMMAVINPAFNHSGVTILFFLKNGNPITLESIIYGVVISIMLMEVILWFSCVNKVFTSDKFIYLFGRIIPGLSLIFSMVLRFVPKFTAQIKVISNGQKCIGRDISNGNMIQRAQNGITILSIMITWALENAIETADSMKARGYGLKGRTAFSIFRFDKRDGIVLSIMVVFFLFLMIGAMLGYANSQYIPSIIIKETNTMSIMMYGVYLAFCLMPVFLDVLEGLRWRQLRSTI